MRLMFEILYTVGLESKLLLFDKPLNTIFLLSKTKTYFVER